jgi:hypothetical protein
LEARRRCAHTGRTTSRRPTRSSGLSTPRMQRVSGTVEMSSRSCCSKRSVFWERCQCLSVLLKMSTATDGSKSACLQEQERCARVFERGRHPKGTSALSAPSGERLCGVLLTAVTSDPRARQHQDASLENHLLQRRDRYGSDRGPRLGCSGRQRTIVSLLIDRLDRLFKEAETAAKSHESSFV